MSRPYERAIYPIAEEFDSLQGEGVYTGTPMRFIRLAGCNVGRYDTRERSMELLRTPADFPILYPLAPADPVLPPIARHSVCTSVFGESFICDTNYRRAYNKTALELLNDTTQKHICITGGEPFLHDLRPLLTLALDANIHVHVETSGTHHIAEKLHELISVGNVWITCSPKAGFLRANMHLINEWKFVVTDGVSAEVIQNFFNYPQGRSPRLDSRAVYLQPVNAINDIDQSSLRRVLDILREHPEWRLSAQLHKYLGLR